MPQPFARRPLLLFLGLLLTLITFVQIGALTLAFDRLGLSPVSALLLLLASLFGSALNLPLFVIRAEAPPATRMPPGLRGLLRPPAREFRGRTLVAVNVGGCLVPVLFSAFLATRGTLAPGPVMTVVLTVATASYWVSRPLPGIGIGMPMFVAPIVAALTAVLVDPVNRAALAYIGGTLGVLIGADLLRFQDIRRMGTPLASIGGAGTFDGIFITGVVAVLLT